MNVYRRILAVMAALILCLSVSVSAFAADVTDETAALEPVEASAPGDEISFEGKSWDEIMDALLAKHNTSRDSVAVAYVNLVSGDEYFINPDTYMVAASMYKLPLNMYFTEKLNSGELEWIYPFPYEGVRDDSIIYSDNNQSMFLYDILGGYDKFRELTSEYLGSNYAELDPNDAFNNKYTAREFANCLKLLYNEQEKFPGMIETMQKAEPERFFKLYEPRFKIAHKYGYYSEYARVNMNDCGIAFTSEPIALVMFTQSVYDPEPLLTDYCTTMCEYTEYLVAKAAATPEPTPTPEASPEPEAAVVEPQVEEKGLPIVSLAAVLIFVIVAIGLVIALCAKYRIRFFWMLLAVIISAVTMLVSIVGLHFGTVYAKPSGDPQQTAVEFMDSICNGDYASSYELLRDYSDLGLSKVPETKAAQLAYEALHKSFSYELSGELRVEKLDAVQPVSFRYLDLTAIESAVVEETPKQLKLIVEKRPMNQIYDSNRNYLPEVTEEAYLNAVSAVLKNADSYCKEIQIQLSLSYSDGKWQVLASPALLRALNGGAGY
jgi:hypothetical protein